MIGGLSRKVSEEEFEFWAKHEVDFMMISTAWDFFLEDRNISHIEKLKADYGLDILIHPREDGSMLLSPANPNAHEIIFEALTRIRDLIFRCNLIHKVILHLATYHIPDSSYEVFTEVEAFLNSHAFYDRLQSYSDLTFVIENGYSPDKGWGEIGYQTEHFARLGLESNYEFCLDTGHLNLSSLTIQDILSLPFDLTCFHLHSNDGLSDQHIPLTQANFSAWPQLLDLLTPDKYIILEVKNRLDKIPYVLEHLRRNEIAPE
jgi:sugar phosphate isomerase/epimerase